MDEGDVQAATAALLSPGSPATGQGAPLPLTPSPAAPGLEEEADVRLQMADMITDFKQTADPDQAVSLFLQMVDMAKRLV